MKKNLLILVAVAVVLLFSGCCAVNKKALDTNLKAWKYIDAEYRAYVEDDEELEQDEKEDLLIPVDEAVKHAEEMVKTIGGDE